MNIRVGDTSGTENSWSEDGDTGNTDPFLHNLEPDDKLYTTTGVKLTRADTEEHGEVRLSGSSLAFELCDVANVLEFGLGFTGVFTSLASKTAEDVTGFFLTASLDEPTG